MAPRSIHTVAPGALGPGGGVPGAGGGGAGPPGGPAAPPPPPTVAPLLVKHDAGRILTDADGVARVRIPVRNPLGVPVHFSTPGCGCACQSAGFAKPVLEPGDSTELLIAVTGRGLSSRSFHCLWHDQTGREWSSQCLAEILPVAAFETERFQHFDLRPNRSFRDRVVFVQHATSEAELPPCEFTTSDARVRIVGRTQTTEELQPGLVRRRTELEVECAAGDEPGQHVAPLRVNQPGVAGCAVEWGVAPAVRVSPANLVLTPADFADTPGVVRRFEVQGVDRPVRVLAAEFTSFPTATARVEGNTVSVEVTRPAATANGGLVVTTDHPDQKTVTIPVSFLDVGRPAGP